MKKHIIFTFLILLMAFVSCKNEKKETKIEEEVIVEEVTPIIEEVKELNILLESKSESNVTGQVVFKEKEGKVIMTAVMSGLEPGVHAIHLHETADCSSADGKSTGGHWNPTSEAHGKWGAETGYHKGDIGNFTADDKGNGMIQFSTDQWCMGCDDDTKNIIGKGIIVHAGEDDLTSQPSGAAGARVSCAGVIE